jgi:polyphosphate kinase
MSAHKVKIINRDISWLSFNDRVLQEAADPRVPLLERIKFLGIYSNNMDEFFRVRVAALKRMSNLNETPANLQGLKPNKVLAAIQERVLELRHESDDIYNELLQELARQDIFIISEKQLSPSQGDFVRNYFQHAIRPTLVPIMLDSAPVFPMLKDKAIYLVALLQKITAKSTRSRHALIELPTEVIPRFLVLPPEGSKYFVILLDDVIRYCLQDIFSIFNFTTHDAYTIKLTRDAELDIEDDVSESILHKISKSLKLRKKGQPVRFIYDESMPAELLRYLKNKLKLHKSDNIIPGGRYHNFKDFMRFPSLGSPEWQYMSLPPLRHPHISENSSLFEVVKKRDILLQFPYQSFDYVIDLLREAAIDPAVISIKMTLYRVAEISNIVNALVNAIKNGKLVTVTVELQARFDEEANIYWANQLREEGAKVIFGMAGLKIHAKLCLITRRERGDIVKYAYVGTGNFNEDTARLYTDHGLLTCHKQISAEVGQVFTFLENHFRPGVYRHLLVSPFFMRARFIQLIDREIANAQAGDEAYIILKLNSIVDIEMIEKLYEASRAGVKIRMIVRGICSLKPGVPGKSENIEAISIIDRFLEHTRIFIFANGGDELIYFGSADWMSRNFDRRIEVACPVYDAKIRKLMKDYLSIQWADNTKARIIDKSQHNNYKLYPEAPEVRAQFEIYDWLKGKSIEGIPSITHFARNLVTENLNP